MATLPCVSIETNNFDHGHDVPEGTIQLSPALAANLEDQKVVAVRCKAEKAPTLQLRVGDTKVGTAVSDVDFARLGVSRFGGMIELRGLSAFEKVWRLIRRAALPTLAFLAAVAAVAAALSPHLKDEMGIATAVLAVPAALIAVVKAI